MMRNKLMMVVVMVAMLVGMAASPGWGLPPYVINFQGKISPLDLQSKPLGLTCSFKVGTFWEGKCQLTADKSPATSSQYPWIYVDPAGVFNVELGNPAQTFNAKGNFADIDWSQQRYLDVNIDNSSIVVQQPFNSVPYAINATFAHSLVATPTIPWGFTLSTWAPVGQLARVLMRQQFSDTYGDYLYLGSTGLNPNAYQSAIMLTRNKGILLGGGSDDGSRVNFNKGMVIDSNGRVGIGLLDYTISDLLNSKLLIQADSSCKTALTLVYNSSDSEGENIQTPSLALNPMSDGSWQAYDYAGRMWNLGLAQKNGKVGVGIAAPVAKLDINGGGLHLNGAPATPADIAKSANQGLFIGWNMLHHNWGETDFINNQGGGTDAFAFMTAQQAASLTASNNPQVTPLMKIDSAGNVAISGSTSIGNPDSPFKVKTYQFIVSKYNNSGWPYIYSSAKANMEPWFIGYSWMDNNELYAVDGHWHTETNSIVISYSRTGEIKIQNNTGIDKVVRVIFVYND